MKAFEGSLYKVPKRFIVLIKAKEKHKKIEKKNPPDSIKISTSNITPKIKRTEIKETSKRESAKVIPSKYAEFFVPVNLRKYRKSSALSLIRVNPKTPVYKTNPRTRRNGTAKSYKF